MASPGLHAKWVSGELVFYDQGTNIVAIRTATDGALFYDSAKLAFGDADDVTIAWDGTDMDVLALANNSVIKFGNGTNSFDIWLYGSAAANYIVWDASANDLILQDNVSLMLGTGSDVELRWDATDLDILAAADDSIIKIGNGTNSFDLWLYGNTAAVYIVWDASADDLIFQDNASIMLGTGNDVEIRWDGTDLDILGVADDLVIKIGNGTNSFDLWIYGNVATNYVLWDASLSKLTLEGVGGGSRRVGGLLYSNTAASTAITNTTTETVFDKYATIPASTLTASGLLKVRFQGIATATNAADTLTIKLYLATDLTAGAIVGTALISMAAQDVANNDVFQGEYTLIVRTIGAEGTVVGAGSYKSIPAAEGTMTIKDDILASTAIDTTVIQYLAVTAAWSAANAGDSCRLDVISVEVI